MSSYVFIDWRVPDYETLLAALAPDVGVILLDATQDGITQIANALEGVSGLDAIYIISHGAEGTLYLGDNVINGDNLASYTSELATIGAALTGTGDMLLYGCEVANGMTGQGFIENLARYTGADVAASDDTTGSALYGGDWSLEQSTGMIESRSVIGSVAQAGYAYVLDTITGTSGNDTLEGTAGNDLLQGLEGDDSISGLDGDDTLDGGLGSDTLDGGTGFDIVLYTHASPGLSGIDVDLRIVGPQDTSGSWQFGVELDVLAGIEGIIATEGGSHLSGNDNANFLQGGPGGNNIIGYGGDDTIVGGAIGDNLNGFTGNDSIVAGGGNDFLIGYTGNDTLDGGAGNDFLDGGLDNDTLMGGEGNDTLYGYGDRDTAVFGGALSGYVFAIVEGAIVVTDINAGDGDDGVDTLISVEDAAFADGLIKTSPWQEFRLNSTQAGHQSDVTIAGLLDGGFLAAWVSSDDGSEGIFAQRVSANGEQLGNEFRINATTANAQTAPAAAALSDGGFVVTWQSRAQDAAPSIDDGIYARRYDASGSPNGGEFLVNTSTTNDQSAPAITGLAGGGFVVAWQSDHEEGGASTHNVFAQRYNASGVPSGGEFRVNSSTAGDQSSAAVTALSNGGFAVAWQSLNQDSSGYGVYAQRYDANGAPAGSEFRVNTTTANDQGVPAIQGLSSGDFVVSWQSFNQDGSGYGVYAQRYDANGALAGTEFRVNVTTVDDQAAPAMAGLANGGFVVTWHSFFQDGGGGGIYARAYDAAGAAVTSEFGVNANTQGDQRLPAVTTLENGGFFVAWQSYGQSGDDGYGIYGQRFSDSAGPVAAELTGDDGSNVITWVDSAAAILTGAGGNDTLSGAGGNDIINGGTGADSMVGGAGNDVYYVDDVGDVVIETTNGPGGPIGLIALGLDGFLDTVNAAIDYSLQSLVFVEDLTLTGTATIGTGNGLDNILNGDTVDNTLNSLAGNDTLNGGAGADLLYGGTGNDTYYVDGQADIVFENVGEGTDTVISTSSFYLYDNIEYLTLTAGAGDIFASANSENNILTGNEGNNLLLGWDGGDTLSGGAGNDVIYGVNGDDSLQGDAGIDVLIAGEGNDTLDGGADPDEMYGENGNDVLYGGTGFVTDILVAGAGNDTLDGSAPIASGQPRNQGDFDFLYGGTGDDTYYVDNPFDFTFEFNGTTEGTDTVIADINGAGFYLYDSVENLTLVGTTVYGVGNGQDNVITGNAIGTFLLGGGGNDTINGKAGNDVLFGEAGADTFVFERGTGGDVIGDFEVGIDKIKLIGIGYNSFADVSPHMVAGATGAIDLGLGDFIVLNGVNTSSLTAGDFLFA